MLFEEVDLPEPGGRMFLVLLNTILHRFGYAAQHH